MNHGNASLRTLYPDRESNIDLHTVQNRTISMLLVQIKQLHKLYSQTVGFRQMNSLTPIACWSRQKVIGLVNRQLYYLHHKDAFNANHKLNILPCFTVVIRLNVGYLELNCKVLYHTKMFEMRFLSHFTHYFWQFFLNCMLTFIHVYHNFNNRTTILDWSIHHSAQNWPSSDQGG